MEIFAWKKNMLIVQFSMQLLMQLRFDGLCFFLFKKIILVELCVLCKTHYKLQFPFNWSKNLFLSFRISA